MLGRGRLTEELYDVLATRQRNVAMRTIMPFVIAGGFGALMGPTALRLWVWAGLYAVVQLREHYFNRSILSRPAASLTRSEVALVLTQFVLGATVFIFGAALLLSSRMQLSASLSVLVVAGALLNSIVVSRQSWRAFLALNLPNFAYIMAMPVLMAAHDPKLVLAPAFALGGFLLCACATITWVSLSRALKSEALANAELERRRAEAEAARDGRAAFTAAISHDLRTPLSAILAASSALEAAALTPRKREHAALISEASRLMRRLLDDLLDFSKLEAGRMRVEVLDFDLHALVDETVRMWAPQAEAKGLDLAVADREVLPRRVRGDPLRLRQVLNNLISNALKFTERGQVRLEFDASPAGADAWSVRIGVADTGEGLEQEAIDRLFQPFEQVSTAVARTHGGTGLGLAISRELARLMGGDLRAEARTDTQGARFVLALTLPEAAAPSVPASADRESAYERDPGAAPRVLAVDDHALGRQALSVLLSLNGCDVRVCSEAGEALEHLAEARFDLVLTDLNMPGLDGRDLTRRLRSEDGPNRETPVLAVSGDTGPQTLASCLAAGMNGLASKPLEPRVLYAAVDAALAAGRGGAPISTLSFPDSVGESFSSHSQTVSTVQRRAVNAA